MKFSILTAVAAAVMTVSFAFGAVPARPELLTSPESMPMLPALSSTQGNAQQIVCQINRERSNRYLSPVFLHRTLSDAALSLGQRYADGNLNSAYFDRVFNSRIAPLGSNVYSSYKVLGTFANDDDYVVRLEQSIYDTLFARTLDAIGIYENSGTYTIVLASGLRDRPSSVDVCPNTTTQYSPPGDTPSPPSNIENGIDLPAFLCAINHERTNARTDAFVVHTALHNEAWEQAKQMSQLGHYTVDGPRKVDESIYGQHVNMKELYWVAGDSFHNVNSLVNVLMSTYSSKVLDPKYQVIGVAQKDGFWSVIFGSLYRSVRARNSCPLTLSDVDYTS
ncbi:hypothetical protein IW137_000266 [Coemansia sp. RSA 1287]|nr:hypothetical protein GGH17_001534 [Coemansia sp. RSA 788]KAJ2167088.1 hypothetical protein GGH15_002347 [Coemansia sp. RSA 562]KAJ2199902.1 hypothetical protein GGH18_000239 [Coemansia sp. RSA 530]KAJ2257357.1 hypothetical protein GGH98_000903 [Coemansia sp. RSA 454]KAJ2283816.1 hypothetical protein GGH14_000587 [Coemansia sp. RSA 370]KAJ2652453.1 hypothetical protein IW137_000266 [Coemansia sp. RSA 1287]